MTDLGKVPPQNIDAEISVLGALLLYPDKVCETILTTEMFYKKAHQVIFAAIVEVSETGICDITTVTDYLRKKGMLESTGGIIYLTKLMEKIVTDQMLGEHSKLIIEKYILREHIRICSEIIEKAYTEDVADVIEKSQNDLLDISLLSGYKEPEAIKFPVTEVLENIRMIQSKEKKLIGVPSGFTYIDRMTGGWQDGNLIVIAGRPSMGKTALALVLLKNAAEQGYPGCLFSLEMSSIEIATRLLSGTGEYTNTQIRDAEVDYEGLLKESHKITPLPFYIDDTAGLKIGELRGKVRKQIIQNRIKMVVVDYLQLMDAKADSREQQVSKISRGLKRIAKEFKIPVIALAQLNRAVETRSDRRPYLSDLRESGAIEQDADIVCFVMRPALYDMKEIEVSGKTYNSDSIMVVDCAKDRNGATFGTVLYHNIGLSKIEEREVDLTETQWVKESRMKEEEPPFDSEEDKLKRRQESRNYNK